jgi:hypothetical protein
MLTARYVKEGQQSCNVLTRSGRDGPEEIGAPCGMPDSGRKNQTMAAEDKKTVDGGPMPLLTFPPNIGILPN